MAGTVMENISDPKISFEAALYFLDGHYLFRRRKGGMVTNKFVSAQDVSAAFSRQEQDTGWLPAGVVRCGTNERGPWFVYSAPEQKTEIWLGDQQISIPLPRTVLVANGKEGWMFALENSHFSPDSLAFRAPFPNVGTNSGKICWGRAAVPAAEPGKAREIWDLFFSSVFNADYTSDKCRSHTDDVRKLLQDLAEGGVKRFSPRELVPHQEGSKTPIGRLVDSILGGR